MGVPEETADAEDVSEAASEPKVSGESELLRQSTEASHRLTVTDECGDDLPAPAPSASPEESTSEEEATPESEESPSDKEATPESKESPSDEEAAPESAEAPEGDAEARDLESEGSLSHEETDALVAQQTLTRLDTSSSKMSKSGKPRKSKGVKQPKKKKKKVLKKPAKKGGASKKLKTKKARQKGTKKGTKKSRSTPRDSPSYMNIEKISSLSCWSLILFYEYCL